MLQKSLINCHARGVDSILFDDTPGARIRMFIAHENHELWKNHRDSDELSVAIHPHHCELDIDVIHGCIHNRKFTASKEEHYLTGRQYKKYLYKSKIKENECKFEYLGDAPLYAFAVDRVYAYNPSRIHLDASELHTVFVNLHETAAWVVYEGKEDSEYQPICYSNTDLTKFDDSGMYQLMTHDYLMRLLKRIYPI